MENFSDSTGLDDLKKVSAGLEDLKGKVENENLIENPKIRTSIHLFCVSAEQFCWLALFACEAIREN